MKLEMHFCAHGERFFGANEDAALTHVDGISLYKLLQGFTFKFNLKGNWCAFFLSCSCVAQVNLRTITRFGSQYISTPVENTKEDVLVYSRKLSGYILDIGLGSWI